jgi:integrase
MNRDTFTPAVVFTRTAPKPLTVKAVEGLKAGGKLSDGAIRPGFGSLKVRKRKTTNGSVAEWLFIWRRAGEPEATMSLGKFSAQPAEGFVTLEEARGKARELQEVIRGGGNPQQDQELARAANRRKGHDDVAAERASLKKSLSALMTAYVDDLTAKKKQSAYDVRNLFDNHVVGAFPEFAAMPASEVTAAHVSAILTRLVGPSAEKTKGRTALKLRAYLAAAFKLALGASTNPMAGAGAGGFGLTSNPAAAVSSKEMAAAFNKKDDRTLSPDELRHYLGYITAMPGLTGLALRLQLFSGGQRAHQLLRLTRADVDDGVITLYDPKGRRTQARTHVLPIIPEMADILKELDELSPKDAELNPGNWLFCSRGAMLAPETMSIAVTDICSTLMHLGQITKEFRGGDIRRTVETVLAETLQISKDTRAQLLSHGLSGVQATVYDRGQHLDAKRAALRSWCDLLASVALGEEPAGGNVVPIKRSA